MSYVHCRDITVVLNLFMLRPPDHCEAHRQNNNLGFNWLINLDVLKQQHLYSQQYERTVIDRNAFSCY